MDQNNTGKNITSYFLEALEKSSVNFFYICMERIIEMEW